MPAKITSTSDSEYLARVFGPGLAVIEAVNAKRATVLPAHMKGALPESAICCGIAKALGGADVAIFRTCSYVKERMASKWVVTRYKNGDDAQSFIRLFDKATGRGKPGIKLTAPVSITLLPVPPSQLKAAMAKRGKQRRRAKNAAAAATKLGGNTGSASKHGPVPGGRAWKKNAKAHTRGVKLHEVHASGRLVITDLTSKRCSSRTQNVA